MPVRVARAFLPANHNAICEGVTSAPLTNLNLVLAVFSATACDRKRGATPERVRKYRQTQPFYRALWKTVNQAVGDVSCGKN